MGVIAKMIDKFTGELNWIAGTWRRNEDTVCIMGAMGLVLQDQLLGFATRYLSGDELGPFVESYKFTPEEDREILTLFTTICEQYPEWVQHVDNEYSVVFVDFPWRKEDHPNFSTLRSAIIAATVIWNDWKTGEGEYVRTQDEVIRVLEKTHIKLSEIV